VKGYTGKIMLVNLTIARVHCFLKASSYLTNANVKEMLEISVTGM
jgi:hypothetical protein